MLLFTVCITTHIKLLDTSTNRPIITCFLFFSPREGCFGRTCSKHSLASPNGFITPDSTSTFLTLCRLFYYEISRSQISRAVSVYQSKLSNLRAFGISRFYVFFFGQGKHSLSSMKYLTAFNNLSQKVPRAFMHID